MFSARLEAPRVPVRAREQSAHRHRPPPTLDVDRFPRRGRKSAVGCPGHAHPGETGEVSSQWRSGHHAAYTPNHEYRSERTGQAPPPVTPTGIVAYPRLSGRAAQDSPHSYIAPNV